MKSNVINKKLNSKNNLSLDEYNKMESNRKWGGFLNFMH
jgi:hypothetical protein